MSSKKKWLTVGYAYDQILYHISSGLYYTPVEITTETTIFGEKAGTTFFNIYSNYEWDNELEKFIGIDQVGYGYKYETESGSSQLVTFDLDGKPTSYESNK